MPVVAHWAVIRGEIAEHRAARQLLVAAVQGFVPSFLIFISYGLFNIGALGIPGLQWLPKMTENYNVRDITEQELTDQQTVCLIVAHLVALGAFHRAVKKPTTRPSRNASEGEREHVLGIRPRRIHSQTYLTTARRATARKSRHSASPAPGRRAPAVRVRLELGRAQLVEPRAQRRHHVEVLKRDVMLLGGVGEDVVEHAGLQR